MHSLGHPTVLLGAVEGEIRYPPAVLGALELCAYTQPLITIVGKRAVRGILELCVYAQTLTAIADKYAVNETLELCAYAQPLTAIADKYAVRECLGVAFLTVKSQIHWPTMNEQIHQQEHCE